MVGSAGLPESIRRYSSKESQDTCEDFYSLYLEEVEGGHAGSAVLQILPARGLSLSLGTTYLVLCTMPLGLVGATAPVYGN